MGSPVTEIAYLTLKPGVDISGSTDAAKAWQEGLSVVKKQEGYQRSYYGRAMESPDLLLWFIDWDSYEAHINFTKSSVYESFANNLGALMEGFHLHHVGLKPFPPTVLGKAPVIEFATFLDTQPQFLDNVGKFMNAVGMPEKCYGGAWGESVETDVGKHEDGSVKGRAVVLVIGWESKEAHMQFRETEVFKGNIGLLREGVGGVEMFHVPFTTV
ncbi:hypothetical protein HYFRA_00001720 [Hymenoscyphus fraxineus]|uniref:ABM domain-containing protein n=1 Tax=Hymenoscyphus fraxineus TaxID=746836 RepID=A0A9N9PZK6_9HELO|nr:hypothetical protein HYFRA_00001720 [Hymenoscyphus fraxineus]